MKCKYFLFVIVSFIEVFNLYAQPIVIDASNVNLEVKTGHLKMGDSGPEGKEIEVNSKYLTFAGEPIIPVMGEIHYSRIAKHKWEETILKMKANGINIIAFYIIWIHHEETEGVFDWTGNKDVRAFVELCKKHNLWAYPRLGPWVHGEVRNGGLPDWLMKKDGMKLRTNDPAYQIYAERLYKESAEQLKGLMYKDGGPIIGIQLENEYWRGKGGEAHIMWLKGIAQKYGFDVPLYTITAWRNTSTPENEVIPLWGGYPTAPWRTDLNIITNNDAFQFVKPINDQSIGNRDESKKYQPDYAPYPYLTCELGVGNQISEHRRPVISPIDGYTVSLSKVASGSNLPGYYVFAGGLNPVGKYTTLEEDKLESGYWNEYPDISYDFQAAITETGELAASYQYLKPLHYFLNTFGNQLAPMKAIIPSETNNPEELQYGIRTNGESGFLFVSNYYRNYKKATRQNVQFKIKIANEELLVPEKPVDIQDSIAFIWPVNMPMGSAKLVQSTTQAITKFQNKESVDWYFMESKGIKANYIFNSDNVSAIKYKNKLVPVADGKLKINDIELGLSNAIEIQTKNSEIHRIFTLSESEALQFWMFQHNETQLAFLSSANLVMHENGSLEIFSTLANQNIVALNSTIKVNNTVATKKIIENSGKQEIQFNYPNRKIQVEINPVDLFQEASWLRTSPDEYNERKSIYNIMFYRDLDLENSAEIRRATMYLVSENDCDIRINDRWLNQPIEKSKVNKLDLTGYLKNENNRCLLKFPYHEGENYTAFAIEIEYFNAIKRVFVSDTTWLTAESYKIPAVWDPLYKAKVPETMACPEAYLEMEFTPNRYQLKLDMETARKNSSRYLRINYEGDKARLYHAGNLIADNFNNQTTWSINLPLVLLDSTVYPILEFDPLKENYQIFYEKLPKKESVGKVEVKDYSIDSEFRSTIDVLY